MRRLSVIAILGLAVLAAACSDQRADQPTAPVAVAPAAAAASVLAGQASDSATIENLLYQLYHNLNNGDGPYNSAETRFQQIARLFINCTLNPPQSPCDSAGAVSNTYNLITDILSKYKSGQLNDLPGYSSPSGSGSGAAVTDLVNLLFRYVGINAAVCSFGTDCNATVYQPGSPAQILTTPSGQAGISLPPGTGTVTQPTVISVSRIEDPAVRLTTQLDQYTWRYLYTSSSGEGALPETPFLQPVTVEVCLQPGQSFPPGAPARLALAHDVAEPAPYENIQILPAANGFLGSCSPLGLGPTGQGAVLATTGWQRWAGRLASLLAPRSLYATAAFSTGTTGTTKTLSPFGAVDTLGFITPASPAPGSAPQGGTVPAPRVRVVTPSQLALADTNGPGMAGIPVTFSVTAGGGCFANPCTPSSPTTLVVTTDARGFAAVPAWTVGLGANTVSATGAIPCTAPVAAGTAQDCGTITTTALAPALLFNATGNPPVKLAFSVQPVTTSAGTSFGVTVLAQDLNGQTVPAFTAPAYNTQVNLTLNASNGATLGGVSSVSATGGVAGFTGLSITRAGTGYTLTAAAAGLTSATSNPFDITAGAAAAIAINGGNNQTAAEGSTLGVTAGTVAPSVLVTDGYGNPVPGAGVSFMIASGGGSIGSPSATTNAAGVAATTWTIVAGTNTLDASVTALGPLPMVSFTATGNSTTSVLVECAPAAGNGDELSRAFYVNKLGKTIKQVTLYLASNDPANVPTPYTIQLIASAESFGATPLGSSTVTSVLRGSASQNLATQFVFPNTVIPPGTKNVAFQFRVLSNPNNAKLYFALSSSSCKSVTETEGVLPLPLSTALRKSPGVKILGN